MAGENTGDLSSSRIGGRGALAAAGAIVATVLLALLMIMVTSSNRAREAALASERHSYDVMLLTRTVDASLARAEAALGRYVLDEEPETGSLYYSEWRLGERQIDQLRRLVRGKPEQVARVTELESLFTRRAQELGAGAAAASAQRGSGGLSLFYGAGRTETGPKLRAKLAEIAAVERQDLRGRMAETRVSGSRADDLTEWLGWIAVLICAGAVVLGLFAFRAMSQGIEALRAADSEANRAQLLEARVRERTQELTEANERLKAEAADRAAAEAQLRQVQKMEAVGQLTGGIAHDFNNMLAVIVGGLDLAKRKLRSSKREVEFHLDNAMEGATRAAALTRRLLAFARAEPLLPVSASPTALVEGMLDLIDRTIGERISITTRFPDDAWHVRVDTNQLENAILNMAVNARDAMDGQGQLAIRVENTSLPNHQVGELGAGDYVRISVADTGAGIAPEVMEHVFEPFFTTKPVGKGTGLGLSQIFGFAHQSGGEVGIESELGKGTTVSIYLPRSESAATPVRLHTAAQRSESEAHVAGARILLVEDDPRVRAATVGALEDLDYEPVACSSGAEAIALFGAHEFDLVISDVIMPEMTGPELIRHLKETHGDFAVLFVTGYVGDGETDHLIGYELLRKPFTVGALANAVSSALSRRPTEPRRSSAGGATG
ncbi:MAG TPA: ATP-binding protein [Allosphingosinicella sp.]